MKRGQLWDRHHLRSYLLAIVAGCGLGAFLATAAVNVVQSLTGDDALQHVGETNTICGIIASAKYLEGSTGSPTYLDFDRPYPKQSCAVVIPGTSRTKFNVAPETAYTGKWVCVTGLISTNNRGQPRITVIDPAQIALDHPAVASPTNGTAATPMP